MCGIAGCLSQARVSETDVKRMAEQLEHRGPDDSGVWVDERAGVALSHQRLSILDLTPAGHQPMESPSNRYVIVFNGEIYNHLALRRKLLASGVNVKWRGHSDTETLLAGFDCWGIEETIKKAVGMFAFAVWDREKCRLVLGRDRLGEKPLYYGWQGDSFLFGSELKALKAHPAFRSEVDRNSLALLMRHNCIPAPHCIWKGVSKLLPGTFLTLPLGEREFSVTTYWSGKEVVEHGVRKPFAGSPEEAVETLETLLVDAIGQQMMADVPLGAFLSGGVDSSTIVALMQAQSGRPVKTFSIGFDDPRYDEAKHAKAVAKHLGTQHTELYVTANDALRVIPELPSLYDEPFSDESQIPTYLVSQMARQHVKVSLSGDAGDELFCGYNRYFIANNSWGKISSIPRPIRSMLSKGITSFSPDNWDGLLSHLQRMFPKKMPSNIGESLHKAAIVLDANNARELYQRLVSHWASPESLVLGAQEPDTIVTRIDLQPDVFSDAEKMMALDMLTYLPDDILTKVDRAGMGVSLETRVPFLDHRVVEFAWQLPLEYKLRNGIGKWVLREVLYKHVPKDLIERPKMGFGMPIVTWLRGPLRDWAECLLNADRLRHEGYFNVSMVRQKWAEHISEKRNWQYLLWDVLMFQAWLEKQ